jgi:hypothetical protein
VATSAPSSVSTKITQPTIPTPTPPMAIKPDIILAASDWAEPASLTSCR